MIVQFIISGIVNMTLGPGFFLLPTLPAMPVEIVDALTAIRVYIISGAGILKYFFGSSFLVAYVGAILVLINFDRAYDLLFWVLGKIPIINIRR